MALVEKMHRVLRHQPDAGADLRRVGRPDIDAVEQHAAMAWVVEAQEKLEDRRLAGSAGTDQRHGFSRRHGQAEIVERRVVGTGGIVEADGVEGDSAWRRRTSGMPGMRRLPLSIANICSSRNRWRSTLQECAAIIDAARGAGVHLVVGHSHSFDAPVRHLRGLIDSGRLWQRAHDQCDQLHGLPVPPAPSRGARHGVRRRRHIQPGGTPDRHCASARRRSRRERACRNRGRDKTRPTEGAYAALLTFENGSLRISYIQRLRQLRFR